MKEIAIETKNYQTFIEHYLIELKRSMEHQISSIIEELRLNSSKIDSPIRQEFSMISEEESFSLDILRLKTGQKNNE